ncbi:hypothetical protein ACLB1G_12245 [Oxalobacteraceae bacterium A2-2]
MKNTVTLDELRALLVNDTPPAATIHFDGAAYAVLLQGRGDAMSLISGQGETLRFSHPTEADMLLRQYGVQDVQESYDAWFARKVHSALDGLADGSNPVIPEDEWARLVAAKKAERDAS